MPCGQSSVTLSKRPLRIFRKYKILSSMFVLIQKKSLQTVALMFDLNFTLNEAFETYKFKKKIEPIFCMIFRDNFMTNK